MLLCVLVWHLQRVRFSFGIIAAALPIFRASRESVTSIWDIFSALSKLCWFGVICVSVRLKWEYIAGFSGSFSKLPGLRCFRGLKICDKQTAHDKNAIWGGYVDPSATCGGWNNRGKFWWIWNALCGSCLSNDYQRSVNHRQESRFFTLAICKPLYTNALRWYLLLERIITQDVYDELSVKFSTLLESCYQVTWHVL